MQVPVWVWERESTQKSDAELSNPDTQAIRASVERAIREVFARERQGARLSQLDIVNLMLDAMMAFQVYIMYTILVHIVYKILVYIICKILLYIIYKMLAT